MASLSEIQRVVFRHDWQCLAEWPRALDELADLTDDEIERVVHSDRQMQTFSARSGSFLAAEGQPLASGGVLQAVRRLRAGASKSLALFFPHARH
jgi:hypothetical protein